MCVRHHVPEGAPTARWSVLEFNVPSAAPVAVHNFTEASPPVALGYVPRSTRDVQSQPALVCVTSKHELKVLRSGEESAESSNTSKAVESQPSKRASEYRAMFGASPSGVEGRKRSREDSISAPIGSGGAQGITFSSLFGDNPTSAVGDVSSLLHELMPSFLSPAAPVADVTTLPRPAVVTTPPSQSLPSIPTPEPASTLDSVAAVVATFKKFFGDALTTPK